MRLSNNIIGVFLVLFIICGTSGCQKSLPAKADVMSLDNVIYWTGSDSGFTSNDFETVVRLSNEVPEQFDKIPDSMGYKLTLNKIPNASYYCKFISLDAKYPWGEFSLHSENNVDLFLVSFTKLGIPVDFMGIRSYSKILNGKGIACCKYYSSLSYASDGRILVNVLDTTQIVEHPAMARIIRKDVWEIDDSGEFVRHRNE